MADNDPVSRGSTLALAYAHSHPDRCTAMILRGVDLFREEDIKWKREGLARSEQAD